MWGKFKGKRYTVTSLSDLKSEFKDLYDNRSYVSDVFVERLDGHSYICIDLGIIANTKKPDMKMQLEASEVPTAKTLVNTLWRNVQKDIPPNQMILEQIYNCLAR